MKHQILVGLLTVGLFVAGCQTPQEKLKSASPETCWPGEWTFYPGLQAEQAGKEYLNVEGVRGYRMRIQWDPTQQQFLGVLTANTATTADLGFTVGELIATYAPTVDTNTWIGTSKWRRGVNGVPTASGWIEETITLAPCPFTVFTDREGIWVKVVQPSPDPQAVPHGTSDSRQSGATQR